MTHIKDDTAEAVVLKEWVLNLETTTMPQIVGDLARYDDCDCEGIETDYGYACVETCASVTGVIGVCAIGVGTYHLLGPADVENESVLAERLGINGGFKVDFPKDLRDPLGRSLTDHNTAYVANLNDLHAFTFEQTADVIRYFGLVSKDDG